MLSKRVKKAVCFLCVISLLSCNAAYAGQASLSTSKINGEAYIKADDLVKALGAELVFDKKTSTYSYQKPNTVPEAIVKVSPAVVGIIGKPDESESPDPDNRYSLAHGTGVIIKEDGWRL
jgi:serine protease Do